MDRLQDWLDDRLSNGLLWTADHFLALVFLGSIGLGLIMLVHWALA